VAATEPRLTSSRSGDIYERAQAMALKPIRGTVSDSVILRRPFGVRTIPPRPRGGSNGRASSCPLQRCRFDSGPRGPWTTKARLRAGLRVAHKSELSTVERMLPLKVQS
jgi:hypothetical protein